MRMDNYAVISIFPSNFLQTLEDGLTGNTLDTWKRRKKSCSLRKDKSVIQPGTCPLTHEEERIVPTYKKHTTNIYTHVHIHMHIHTHAYTHMHTHMHTQTYAYTHTHTHRHTHTHTGIHTCTHRHTHMHTCTPPTHTYFFSKVL